MNTTSLIESMKIAVLGAIDASKPVEVYFRTDEQIAANMGICRDTLIQWKKKYSDISDTLKRGKEVVDIQVENSCGTEIAIG